MKKKLNTQRKIVIALFALFCANSMAQNYTITGVVCDSASNEKLFYATVGLLKAEDSTSVSGVSTNEKGEFTLSNIAAGNYLFKISYVGYHPYIQPLTVEGGEKNINMGTIQLVSSFKTLAGFEVIDKKPVYTVDGEKTLYNVSEDPAVQTGTASDALQNAPGVEVDVEGNITLRGVSSVEIWINDKPSRLNAENLKTYIQQMPANSIERIEVITNPSAKYSAKGSGGIINIVTNTGVKKNSFISFGVNGSTSPRISPFISFGYQNKKLSLNLYLNGSFSIWKSNHQSYDSLLNENKELSSYKTDTSESNSRTFGGGLYVNFSYEIDTMNELSFWGGGYPNFNNSSSIAKTARQEFITNPDAYIYTEEGNSASINGGGWFGLGYEHKFNNEGHKLNADISGNYWGDNSNSTEKWDYTTHPQLNVDKKNPSDNDNFSISSSIDYTLPYLKNKGEISVGLTGNYNHRIELSVIDTLSQNGEYQTDSLRLWDGIEKGYEMGGYVTVRHKFGNFTLKAGFRTEYENIDLEIFNSPKDNVHEGRWGFFPSLHLSYKTKSMHNFSLSYTRRVSFPQASEMTTFIRYYDESFSMGNPDLKPTFTNSVNADWTKYFEKFGSVGISAYFRNSTDVRNEISDVMYNPYFGRIVTFSQPFNSGAYYSVGGDVNVTYRLKAFMNIRFYGRVNYDYTETMFRKDQTIYTRNLTYSFRLNFWAKLWKVLEIHASANYSSPSKSVFSTSSDGFSVNCGLRADFLKRKISVYVNANDIFNTRKYTSQNSNPYYISNSTRKYNTRSVSAGITFRFGKMELESSGGMQGGAGEPNGM
ncbi:MAG: TonB-dependent receptor [Bacteroidales bacterium]|jgi:hypothetical protein|nr:TonB-dependent receptor [Bacteroidales bacterium]